MKVNQRRSILIFSAVGVVGLALIVARCLSPLATAAEQEEKEQATMNTNVSDKSSTKRIVPADEIGKPRPDSEWKKVLTPEQYHVAREAGTEQAFTGEYWNNHKDGLYLCVCCGEPLFSSNTKFESGTGLPRLHQPYDKNNITDKP